MTTSLEETLTLALDPVVLAHSGNAGLISVLSAVGMALVLFALLRIVFRNGVHGSDDDRAGSGGGSGGGGVPGQRAGAGSGRPGR